MDPAETCRFGSCPDDGCQGFLDVRIIARPVDAGQLRQVLPEALRLVRNAAARLVVGLESAQLRRRGLAGLDAVTVLPDLAAVTSLLEQEAARCRYEVIACRPGDVSRDPANLEPAVVRDRALLERGVRMRTLQQHVVRFHAPTRAYIAAATALGGEYRTAHELFGRLIVFDDTVAFLPTDTTTSGAVVVREPHLIAYLRSIFEQAWTHATEFIDPNTLGAEGFEQAARDIDTTLLKLLAAGLKDETIARRLGMSLRTVRRHVADILERLGAESRFQAAVIVTHTGLLGTGDDEPGR
ncbi:helix-turn-helix transcriptional regulator [Streptomyces roseoverticillatus]|nr:helix-turn-helix transcriptional regulator [Streptomyces roseoverticillatus]